MCQQSTEKIVETIRKKKKRKIKFLRQFLKKCVSNGGTPEFRFFFLYQDFNTTLIPFYYRVNRRT